MTTCKNGPGTMFEKTIYWNDNVPNNNVPKDNVPKLAPTKIKKDKTKLPNPVRLEINLT